MKGILGVAGGIAVAALLAVGTVLALGGADDNGGQVQVRDEDSAADCAELPCDETGGGSALGVCIEGVPDCVDTIVCSEESPCDTPHDGGSKCAEDAAYCDEPVSHEPVTSIDDLPPDQCNLVHNIDVCEELAQGAATKDLAVRTGASFEEITVVSSELVEWPNACIGVEQPDVACAEIITPGFKIVLQTGGATYEYHTDTTGAALVLAN